MRGNENTKSCILQGSFICRTSELNPRFSERVVFRLQEKELVLMEIAPGIDLQKDILDQMDFLPLIPENLKTMDASIFMDGQDG